jgi:hypothetical protein
MPGRVLSRIAESGRDLGGNGTDAVRQGVSVGEDLA